MATAIKVVLDGWIIQDGNYNDFTVGPAEFAVEFYAVALHRMDGTQLPRLTAVRSNQYEIVGTVVLADKDGWVLDVGELQIFQEAKSPLKTAVGDCFGGVVTLGVDPFFYFERLALKPNWPALIYPWFVTRIEKNTTPWIQDTLHDGRHSYRRDDKRESFVDVTQTGLSSDREPGGSSYLLSCSRQGAPSKRSLFHT